MWIISGEAKRSSSGRPSTSGCNCLSERPIQVPGVLAKVRIVGGVRVQVESYSDGKLIAVLLLAAAIQDYKDAFG